MFFVLTVSFLALAAVTALVFPLALALAFCRLSSCLCPSCLRVAIVDSTDLHRDRPFEEPRRGVT